MSQSEKNALPKNFLPNDVEVLEQMLADTENEWADLAALHGNFGKYNDERKILLAESKLATLEQEVPTGARAWTDDLRDCAGRVDKHYRAYVDDSIVDAKRFHKLDRLRARVERKLKNIDYSPVR